MTEILRPDLCVLGGGGAGLAAARAAAASGAKVVVVEKRALGGAYLTRAVPAAAFCVAAASRERINQAARMGVTGADVRLNLGVLRSHIRGIVKHFAIDNSPARLAAMNIDIVRAVGCFGRPTRLDAGGFAIDARYFIVATGSAAPALPAIAGLELVRPFLADDLMLLDALPRELIVVGTSFETLALAQAFSRLGSRITLIEPGTILPAEDPELLAPVLTKLVREGVTLIQHADIKSVAPQTDGIRVTLGRDASAQTIEGTHLMLGAPPTPLVEGFGLKAAGVAYTKTGITVNGDGQTSNRQIYAIGEAAAESGLSPRHQGERIAAALFGERRRRPPPVARVLATDPELATVGLSEVAARARYKSIRILRAPFCENEQARIADLPAGHIKIVTDSHGTFLGAGIVGPHARELIGIFCLAIDRGMAAADLQGLVSTAPTLSEACRTAALASLPKVGKASGRRSPWPPRRIR